MPRVDVKVLRPSRLDTQIAKDLVEASPNKEGKGLAIYMTVQDEFELTTLNPRVDTIEDWLTSIVKAELERRGTPNPDFKFTHEPGGIYRS